MEEFKITKNIRGFGVYQFTDYYKKQCSVQKSTLASKDAIWIGIDNPELVIFKDSTRGAHITTEMPSNFSVNTRMHLTREQVAELLPLLQRFVDTGDIVGEN